MRRTGNAEAASKPHTGANPVHSASSLTNKRRVRLTGMAAHSKCAGGDEPRAGPNPALCANEEVAEPV